MENGKMMHEYYEKELEQDPGINVDSVYLM